MGVCVHGLHILISLWWLSCGLRFTACLRLALSLSFLSLPTSVFKMCHQRFQNFFFAAENVSDMSKWVGSVTACLSSLSSSCSRAQTDELRQFKTASLASRKTVVINQSIYQSLNPTSFIQRISNKSNASQSAFTSAWQNTGWERNRV